jgi:membrane-associated phospholipid phosphatase
MYNDRHWLTDVAAGAGIGILCTKTYWLYPKCKNFKKGNKTSVMIAPFITEKKRNWISRSILMFQRNFHQFGFYDTTK